MDGAVGALQQHFELDQSPPVMSYKGKREKKSWNSDFGSAAN